MNLFEKMIDLDFFAKIKVIRQERKILEDRLENYLKKQAPMGYPSSTILPDKVQSNRQTPEAISVYNNLLELIEDIKSRVWELKQQEIQILNEIKKIKDVTIRNVISARYDLNLSFKEIYNKYGIRKQDFFNNLKKYTKKTKKTKNDEKDQSSVI